MGFIGDSFQCVRVRKVKVGIHEIVKSADNKLENVPEVSRSVDIWCLFESCNVRRVSRSEEFVE